MDFSLGLQTMVGLPGSDEEKELDTARKVVGLAPAIVRIYPTLVIRGTHLEKNVPQRRIRASRPGAGSKPMQ